MTTFRERVEALPVWNSNDVRETQGRSLFLERDAVLALLDSEPASPGGLERPSAFCATHRKDGSRSLVFDAAGYDNAVWIIEPLYFGQRDIEAVLAAARAAVRPIVKREAEGEVVTAEIMDMRLRSATPGGVERGTPDWTVVQLRSALENYGRHFPHCPHAQNLPEPCTCGLMIVLAGAEQATDATMHGKRQLLAGLVGEMKGYDMESEVDQIAALGHADNILDLLTEPESVARVSRVGGGGVTEEDIEWLQAALRDLEAERKATLSSPDSEEWYAEEVGRYRRILAALRSPAIPAPSPEDGGTADDTSADTAMLDWLCEQPFCDQFGDIDIHEEACRVAGGGEPTREHYRTAGRNAIRAAMSPSPEPTK